MGDEIAADCPHWKIAPPFELVGTCEQCGVAWQSFSVAFNYRCPYFATRSPDRLEKPNA